MSAVRINVHSVLGIENLGGPGYCLSVSLQMTEGQKRETAAQLLGSMPTDKAEQFLRAEFAELFDDAQVAPPAGEPVTAAYGSVWRNGGLVVCNHFDREPCPHQPERRCGECPGRIPPTAARVPLTTGQMVDAVAPLCINREVAEILVGNSMDEYRAIEHAHGITGDAA